MPSFRQALAGSDRRPVTAEIVRDLCAAVTRAAHFFATPPLRIIVERRPGEEVFWEVFHGRLLDATQTRDRRRFEAWNVHLVDADGARSAEPVISLKFDAGAGHIYVTRSILCHAHEPYDAGGNVVLTREVQRWQRELVGSVILDDLPDAGALHDELAGQVFHAVVGTSRLPLTSVETPLPAFALGQLAYCYRPAADDGPMTTVDHWRPLPDEFQLAAAERIKHLEFVVRAAPAGTPIGGRASADVLELLRGVFNAVTLSPYTDFVPKVLAAVRQLVIDGTVQVVDRVDFLTRLVRQLARHLAAYDLVTFHHRGANYPDALLLDDLMAELAPLAERRPDLFAGESRAPRLRRRAIRHAILLRLQYAGHPVPDAPTSAGENLRVLPEPFARVPDEQLSSPAARGRRLFTDDRWPEMKLIRHCLADLDHPGERQELGTALFLDRPLGFAKAPGEPDQTWLASHVLFSPSLAAARMKVLGRRPDWLPDGDSVDRWREKLSNQAVDGLPLGNAGAPPRPGVVSLHDAMRVADDFVLLRTTRQAVRELCEQYDVAPLAHADLPRPDGWRLVIPGERGDVPTMHVYDDRLVLRLELAADVSRGYRTRGGAECLGAGLRVLRAWGPGGAGDEVDLRHESVYLRPL